MLVYKNDIIRDVRDHLVQEYLDAGWTTQLAKKKKAEKPAETAPEAAQEDLGNAINTGE